MAHRHEPKATIRVASFNSRAKFVANAQELGNLLKSQSIDILGTQEVKSHLAVLVPGYVWLSGLDRFFRPANHLGIVFLVKKRVHGLVKIASVDKTHEFMWLKLAGKGSVQETYICVAYCLTQKHPVELRKAFYAALLESCSKYMAKGEVFLLGDFNARLGAIMGDRGIVNSNGKLLLSFLHSAFADGDNGDYNSLLNASFDCKGKPTKEESGWTSIIDYLITAPESLQRVDKVHVECRNQTAGANALGSDHHLLYLDWKVMPVADTPEDPRRRITNYLKLQRT
jgi:exonuclease III